MSKTRSANDTNRSHPGYHFVTESAGVEEYTLKRNGLRVLYLHRPDTGVVTTNITYRVGARDEARGETGVAHMLEHMLFKPTTYDLAQGLSDGGAMHFERDTGCILNANTWKDRTTYYFSYPREFFERALEIEAERMDGVILTPEELAPEQGNVLSEFDMYNGDPYFALAVEMVSTAYHSHPYGHETIGYREDIEAYTAETLERFYRNYYRPDNATMMVIGDIDRKTALTTVRSIFGSLENPATPIPRFAINEPKQEGIRRVSIARQSSLNIVSIGFKHAGFPEKDWFVTNLMLEALCEGPESILERLLVDTGKASGLEVVQEPTSEENLACINITLAPRENHEEIEQLVRHAIERIDTKTLTPLVKKAKARLLTEERFARSQSLRIAQELTEYVASGDWTAYGRTPETLEQIRPVDVKQALTDRFQANNLTIGHFIGTARV